MSIVVTGATGHLGRLVVESLLERGVPASDIVGTGRDIRKARELADRGVPIRRADFDDPDSLLEGFAGASKLLLVSGSDIGRRREQHRRVIDAAAQVGVDLLVYTSIANADRARMALAADHQATEEALAASGLPYALLRNSWYLETYTDQVPTYLEHGAVLGSAGDGKVSAAARADYAEAAAVVLLRDDEAGQVYELGGDTPFSLTELAEAVSEASGQSVAYHDLPVEEYTSVLVQAGLPEPFAATLADSDRGLARGELLVDTGHLRDLLGRPTTPMPDAILAAVATDRPSV